MAEGDFAAVPDGVSEDTVGCKLGFVGEKSKHRYEAPSGRGLPRSGWGRGRHKRIRFVLFRKMIKQDFFVRFLTHAPSVCLRQPPPSRREAWVRRDPNPPTNPNLSSNHQQRHLRATVLYLCGDSDG